MKRQANRYVVFLVVFGLIAGLIGFSSASAGGSDGAVVSRISGDDRYSTAVEVSKYDRQEGGYVVLARGDHYADALAGVPLAVQYDAPILLTQRDVLTKATRREIEKLAPHTVIILGGPSAVSQSVEEELLAMSIDVDRIAGDSRFDTAAKIALRVGGTSSAVVASGMDFPDALAVASYAAAAGQPILLTQKDKLPAETSEALEKLDVAEVVLVGGVQVVSNAVMEQLPDAVRIGGQDRSETSVLVAEHFGLSASTVFVATGYDFADAISGAVLAAREASGLVLVGKTMPASVADFLDSQDISSAVILGGESAVSKAIEDELKARLSLVDKRVEVTAASLLTENPGSGAVLRYPYAGYVTTVLDVDGDYVQIRFGSRIGWILQDNVAETDKEIDDFRMGWQFTRASNNSFLQQAPGESGYNVYAPVMYSMGNKGLVTAVNYSNNIKLAKEQGYQVWLTIAQFGTSPNLRDESIAWIIDKVLELDVDGINIDYEGMGKANRDAFTAFMGKLYAQTKQRNLVLSVDVNRHSNNVYGASYDREALGRVSDYVILMAYDEHWSSSPQEGAVASHPWTRKALELLVEEVPAEKVILGMPFYTRNWEIRDVTILDEDSVVITGDAVRVRTEPTTAGGSETTIFVGHKDRVLKYAGQVEGENIEGVSTWYKVDLDDGNFGYITGKWSRFYPAGSYLGAKEVHSMSLGQKATQQIVANYDPESKTSGWISSSTGNWIPMYNVSFEYDPESGQDVVTWICQFNYLNKIWLENPQSLAKRAALAEEFGLAGLAAWSLDWMDSEAQLWNTFRK